MHPGSRSLYPGVCLGIMLLVGMGQASTPALAGMQSDDALTQTLEDLAGDLEARRIEEHVAGMSVAIVQDGRLVFVHGFGTRDFETDAPVNEHTLFSIGSCTKAMTSTLIAMLVDEGRMDWDEPVRTHVPDFRLKDKAIDDQVTIRDLLCHRTGFTRMSILFISGQAGWEDMQPCIARADTYVPFRSGWNYNNIMYMVAGRASSMAGGEDDWHVLLRQRLLVPLGMDATISRHAEVIRSENRAHGYRWLEDEMRYEPLPLRGIDNAAPAGSVASSAVDMGSWLRFLLEHDPLDALEETWTPQIEVGEGMAYGMGWMLGEWHGEKMVHHGGNIDGFSANIAILPESNIAAAVLTSANVSSLPMVVMPTIFIALKEEDEPQEAGDLSPFLGSYHFELWNADMTVLERNGRLAVDVPGQTIYELEAPDDEGHRAFMIDAAIQISFIEDEDGIVEAMVLHQNGMDFRMPRQGYEGTEEEVESSSSLQVYLGRYQEIPDEEEDEPGDILKVILRNSRLAIEGPGQPVLELSAPDEEGTRSFRMIESITVRFSGAEQGHVGLMQIIEGGEATEFLRLDAVLQPETTSVEEAMALVHIKCGSEAYLQMENLHLHGTVTFNHSGVTGSADLIMSGFDRYALECDLGLFGSMKWTVLGTDARDEMSFLPAARLLEDSERQFARLMHPFAWLGDWGALFETIRFVERSVEDGVTHLVCEGDMIDLPGVRFAIDADSGHLLSLAAMVTDSESSIRVPITIRYEDYRDIEGASMPHRWIWSNPMNGDTTLQFTENEMNLLFEEIPFLIPLPEKDASQ